MRSCHLGGAQKAAELVGNKNVTSHNYCKLPCPRMIDPCPPKKKPLANNRVFQNNHEESHLFSEMDPNAHKIFESKSDNERKQNGKPHNFNMLQDQSSSSSSFSCNISVGSSSNNNNNKMKSVRFNEKAKMRLALHISDYETAEFKASFCSQEDYHRFRQDAKSTAQHVDKQQQQQQQNEMDVTNLPIIHTNDDDDDDDCEERMLCIRGVENMTREGSAQRAIHRRMANVAVFLEQERLQFFPPELTAREEKEEEEFDNDETKEELPTLSSTYASESIAAVYAVAALASIELAHSIGLADQEEVLKLWSDDDDDDSSNKGRKKKKNKKSISVLSGFVLNMDWSRPPPSSSRINKAAPSFEKMKKKHQNKRGGVYLRRLVGATARPAS